MKNRLLFIIFIILAHPVHSQSACDCAESVSLTIQKRQVPKFDNQEAITKLKNSHSKGCLPKYHEWIAEEMIVQRKFDSASLSLETAVDLYRENSCSNLSYLKNYQLQASISHHLGDYTKSVELCFKILSITEATGETYDRASTLLLLSNSFNRMKQSEKGVSYARQAAPLVDELTVPHEKAVLLLELGSRYLWRYQDTKNKLFLDTAEGYIKKELFIAKENSFTDLIGKGFGKMNGLAHELKNYPLALKYNDSSILLLQQTGNRAQLGTAYGDKADVFMEMKDYTNARLFADSCLALHKEAKNPETIANAYALIYEISNRSENYKDAVWAMNEYLTINDSLTAVEKSKEINELEKKYSQAKNENKIKDLDKKKQLYLLLAIAGLLAALAIGFFLRQQSLKHKKNILETEQRLNRARMNPHFFFNALAALQKFAVKENNPEAMASNLSKFSNIMRETLESTYKEYVSIEQEMEFLNEYLEVQKIRFPHSFTYEVKADKNLEVDELLIPAMIIQPFVENSIEHGFAGVEYPGNVSVSFAKDNKDLLINITDNGKGLTASIKDSNEHISRASQIIKDRIYLLNIKLKTKAGFSIDNAAGGKGVIVKINLPLLYKNQTTS